MRKSTKIFVGKGRNFEEALKAAIIQAKKANTVIDGGIAWKLHSLEGYSGGLFSVDQYTVEIEVQVWR